MRKPNHSPPPNPSSRLIAGKGDNKPGQLEYNCRDIPCGDAAADPWLQQACKQSARAN